jgi:hypothetical protein
MFGILLAVGAAIVFGPKIVRAARHAYGRGADLDRPALGTCSPSSESPNPTGGDPIAGQATALGYQWCHTVRRGDTAGSLAETITSDRRRYLELVAANPQYGVATRKTASGGSEINFRDEPQPGDKLKLPKSWNPWIDQNGEPRRIATPFQPFDTMPPYPVVLDLLPGLLPTMSPTGQKGWA